MRSTVVVLFLAVCFATIGSAGGPAQLIGSVEAVYHEGQVTFQVEHADAVSSSIKVYDLSTDALIYDSGPRARTLVSWPAGHDLAGAFRYVVTAWNDQGEVVVSQAAVAKSLTPISNITFDTIPGGTKFLSPNEVIIESDLQVGANQGVRLDQDVNGHGGGITFFEEDGSTSYASMNPDFDGHGGFFHIKGSSASGSYIQAQGMDAQADDQASFRVEGTSDFGVYSGHTGTSSVVMPANAVSATEMENEPGVAAKHTWDSWAVPASPANAIGRTIDVPSAGYIMATAVVDISLSHTTGTDSSIVCSISETSNSLFTDGMQDYQIASSAPSGTYKSTIPMTRIFPVTTGEQLLYVVCANNSTVSAFAYNRHLNILFVPTAYGAVTTKNIDGHMEGVEGYVPSTTSVTQAEIDAERAESIAFNLARIQAELDAIKAQAKALAGPDANQR